MKSAWKTPQDLSRHAKNLQMTVKTTRFYGATASLPGIGHTKRANTKVLQETAALTKVSVCLTKGPIPHTYRYSPFLPTVGYSSLNSAMQQTCTVRPQVTGCCPIWVAISQSTNNFTVHVPVPVPVLLPEVPTSPALHFSSGKAFFFDTSASRPRPNPSPSSATTGVPSGKALCCIVGYSAPPPSTPNSNNNSPSTTHNNLSFSPGPSSLKVNVLHSKKTSS